MPASTCCSPAVNGSAWVTSGRSKPSPSPPGHRHRWLGLAGRVVRSEQPGQRGADLAGVEEAFPQGAGALGQLGVDVTPLAYGVGSAHLPRIAPENDAGLEGHQVSGLHRVSRLVRRHGSWREVIHATSCPDGVVTPAAAMASMNTAVNCRSVTPGTNACVAAAAPPRLRAPTPGWPRPPRGS